MKGGEKIFQKFNCSSIISMALHTTYLTTEGSEPFTYFTDEQRSQQLSSFNCYDIKVKNRPV